MHMTLNEAKRISEKYLKVKLINHYLRRHYNTGQAGNYRHRAEEVNSLIQQCKSTKQILSLIKKELEAVQVPSIIHCSPCYAVNNGKQVYEQFKNSKYIRALHRIVMILTSPKMLVFSFKCNYKEDIIKFCMDKMVFYKELKHSSDKWVRDYLYTAYRKENHQLFHRQFVRNDCRHDWFGGKASVIRLDEKKKKIKALLNSEEARNLKNIRFRNSSYVCSTNKPLEGGNLFFVYNKEGARYVVIGDTILKQIQSFEGQKATAEYDEIIIEHLKEHFCTSRIIIIPNLSYHLDMQMCYIGNSTFIINSLEEVIRLARTTSLRCFSQYSKELVKQSDIVRVHEKQVEEIIKRLNENGFTAVKCAGTLYRNRYDVGQANLGKAVLGQDKGFVASSHMNGFDVYSAWKDCFYYVTIDSHIQEHKEYFRNFLKGVMRRKGIDNFEVIFVNMIILIPKTHK